MEGVGRLPIQPQMERQSTFWTWWSYTVGSVTTFIGAIDMQTVAVVVGILATLGTWLVNWWYKRKEDRRAAESHEWERQARFGLIK